MERRSGRRRGIDGQGVALKAQQVYVAAPQQTRVGRSMRHVAGDAALGLDGSMLPGEWTGLVGVAVEADHVLRGGGTQLAPHEAAVLVMAIAADQQAFIHAMVIGLGKIGLDFEVAAITQGGLRGLQKLAVDLGRMHRVAINATHVVLQMRGAEKIGMLFPELMASQAALGGLLARQAGKADDLVRIGGLSVGFARSMAGFTTLPLRTMALVQHGLPVRPAV